MSVEQSFDSNTMTLDYFNGNKYEAADKNRISSSSNIELWLKFKSGDSKALGALAEIHYKDIFHYATKFSSDRDFILDTMQELYLELWERRTFLSETAFVKSYLLKAMRHKLTKESIRLRRFKMQDVSFDSDNHEGSIESYIIDDESTKQLSERIKRNLSLLSRRQQEAIYLRFYQNLDNEGISRVMNLNRQCVSNLLYRSLKEIRASWIA